jgi:hypothetical protein
MPSIVTTPPMRYCFRRAVAEAVAAHVAIVAAPAAGGRQ